MIKSEFLRFLQTLNADDIPPDVRKIANVVFDNLSTLIPLSTAYGHRVNKLAILAQTNWNSLSTEIQSLELQTTEQSCPFTQLESLSVGPFRGFTKIEDFELASQIVLIYGPNGTGKSSFCEALEFGLLGNVADAESKRFHNQQDYLRNAHTNKFEAPILVGIDDRGQKVRITPNEVLYRFCFIEKNRIDNFARIAAQTPAKQTELISTLFGLEAFTEFVSNFSDIMNGKYITLDGVKAKELNQKRLELAGYKQQLELTIPEEFKKIDEEQVALARQYRESITFSQLVSELNGTGDAKGLIQVLDDELQKIIPQKSNLTNTELQALKEAIEVKLNEFNAKQQELTIASQQVSFKQLYEAVLQVQTSSPINCPACKTSLEQVAVNPFEHANAELRKLQHLSNLQEAINKLTTEFSKCLNDLSQIIKTCLTYFPNNNQLSAVHTATGNTSLLVFWNSLHRKLGDGFTPWQHIESQVKHLENNDIATDLAEKKRSKNQYEIKRLRGFAEFIVKLNTRRETAINAKEKAENAIKKFDIDNMQLVADVETEKSIIAQNIAIATAYESFVKKLNAYANSLPAQLVANLGDIVVTLYNAFNRNDPIHEQLDKVRLPLSQNQRLEISYKNSPETFFDALHILSEGHIRSIGLAILAAKNIKENCRLLIFDDPVNAIDDDHRESIRKTLFEDNFFDTKQIILACHGEEFFKDIQNMLPAKKIGQSIMFSFLPKIEDFNIKIDRNCSPRNYILAARAHFDRNEIRDALSKSRQTLESLTKGKLWHYVNKYGDGNLSIKMRSATSPIELRNLTEQLKLKIFKNDFTAINKNSVLHPLDSLLGINGDSREWRYLNKGTHEEIDRAEFDRQTVEHIVATLEQLDAVLG